MSARSIHVRGEVVSGVPGAFTSVDSVVPSELAFSIGPVSVLRRLGTRSSRDGVRETRSIVVSSFLLHVYVGSLSASSDFVLLLRVVNRWCGIHGKLSWGTFLAVDVFITLVECRRLADTAVSGFQWVLSVRLFLCTY